MRLRTRIIGTLSAVACLLFIAPAMTAAQTVTTGSINGTVTDVQGGVLPGATVTAVHTPTGTSYEAVTGPDGRYTILNVRVGPYRIAVTMSGFKEDHQDNVDVQLGGTRTADFKLQLASVSETVQVTAQSPLIDLSHAGTEDNISGQVKDALPTINRSLADIVRINPLFNTLGGGSGADTSTIITVAGNSYRYNSLQIDGAVNNDLFGLGSSAGVPGGTAETQPISFDAVQEVQLVVSPYDVRQGGFTGGGINVITKSGSNDLHGTGFYQARNQDWVGKGVTNTKISTLRDKQGGFGIGGPIVKNEAFFYGNAEWARKARPTGFSVSGTGTQFLQPDLFNRYISDLENLYHYTPGDDPGAEFPKATNSNKYFVRGDFNVAKGNQLTIRNNDIDALNDINGSLSATTFRTPDAFYRYVSKTNSTVGQLNSQFGKGVNEFRLTYTRVRDHRESPVGNAPFPQITVTLAAGVTAVSGTEQFSGQNAINQDITELNDAYTLLKGNHTITIGTHNEFLKLSNLFIRDFYGTYNFSSLANFEAGVAQQYDHSFSATSDPHQRAQFSVRQWGFYAGDTWRARSPLTITYGLRVDAPRYPTKPDANPIAVQNFGYATDVVPNGVEWSPRVGVNYDLSGNGTRQIRGGVGIFTGRPAYVWISNQFGNTGIDFTRIGASFNSKNAIPFVADPVNQPTTVTGASAGSFTNEIDVIDPDFKYPTVLRGNIGFDHTLPYGFVGSADFVWSNTLEDIKYQNLNYVQVPGVTGVGGRPFFARKVPSLSDVILLQNTNQGYTWDLTYQARRTFQKGLFLQAAYSYGRAKSIMDGTSDQAASNWGNVYVPGDPNNPPLSTSDFDPGQRITLTGSYDVPFARRVKPVVSLVYSGRTGRPYTLTYFRDVNGDNRGFNDLEYIPTATDPIDFVGGTYQDYVDFLKRTDSCLSKYVGQIIPRNACRAPWTNSLDGRFAIQLPIKKYQTEVTLDAFNLINLFDRNKGLVKYVSFGQLEQPAVIPSSVTATSPLTGYNISTIVSPNFQPFLLDDLRSRWQLQLGVHVRF
ncbi:MAG TPA: carboxypeptidase regulatory-like domain-containing protein [Vicinamibacterales bacterium]|nr:carboxypeptidase regulatory-like domain-containing protein [Vicinamibacterales bacterium]